MAEQVECLSLLFMRKDVDLFDDDGDDNANGEYWEIKDPECFKSWSIVLVPMTDNINIVMTFSAAAHALPILADK